jgi:hypothetical protein
MTTMAALPESTQLAVIEALVWLSTVDLLCVYLHPCGDAARALADQGSRPSHVALDRVRDDGVARL